MVKCGSSASDAFDVLVVSVVFTAVIFNASREAAVSFCPATNNANAGSSHSASVYAAANSTTSPAECAFTTELTDLVTVHVCGDAAPLTAVTVTTSPPHTASNG